MFKKSLLTILFATIVATTLMPAKAQQAAFKDTKLIPSSAIAAVFLHPKAILDDPTMELMPRELLSALAKREIGIDPCEIESAMVLMDNVGDDPGTPPGFSVTVRFNSEQTLNDNILERTEKDELRGKPIYRASTDEFEPVIYLPNNKTIVFGIESFIKKMLSAKGAKSGLIDLVNNSQGDKDHVNAFLNVEPIRGFLDDNLPPVDQIPLPFQSFRNLPDEIESASFRMSFTNQESNYLKLNATDEEAGKKVMQTMEQALSLGRGMLMTAIANELSNQPELMDALEAYDDRAGDKIEEMLKPELEGRTLTFKGGANQAQLSNVAVVGTLVGMLLPAVQQVRGASRRVTSMNNLRQICLASLNYESAYMNFPSNIKDEDGEPLLSWRVAILPFIEQNALYEEFHLDEPWDSEHNIKLLDRMPDVFKSPNVDSDTKTVYLGFQGEGTMHDPDEKSIGFGAITDGSSNTIFAAEANENAAIEWSKPQDLEFDRDRPGKDVGDLRPGGFNVVLCDGSVHFVSSNVDSETLANMILRADGNVVNGW